jgi:hypothetical protein
MGAALPASPATFTKDVAPIFQEKCQDCHRKGSMAPMSLVTYEGRGRGLRPFKKRVIKRQMPPWHIDKTVGIQHFQNDISLSDEQIATIVRWVDSGAPMGDPKDMPPAKQWPKYDGWQLAKQFGQPDIVLKSDSYTMLAKGQDLWFKPYTEIPLTRVQLGPLALARPKSSSFTTPSGVTLTLAGFRSR